MDQRTAKRLASRFLATHAEGIVASIGQCLRDRNHWQGRPDADALRVRAALVELSEELRRRSIGERRRAVDLIDPRQGKLFDLEADHG